MIQSTLILHFGPFAQDWWFESTTQTSIGLRPLIPIHVGMKTEVELNNRKLFYMLLLNVI